MRNTLGGAKLIFMSVYDIMSQGGGDGGSCATPVILP